MGPAMGTSKLAPSRRRTPCLTGTLDARGEISSLLRGYAPGIIAVDAVGLDLGTVRQKCT
jgi:hypothetical protein